MPNFVDEEALITMDPAIKAQWVSDLRSGDIEQGRAVLHRTDGSMCCLGVLTKLASDAGAVKKLGIENSADNSTKIDCFRYGVDENNESYFFLTNTVSEWAGIITPHGMSLSGRLPFNDKHDRPVTLDALNDLGFSFSQIADLIDFWY